MTDETEKNKARDKDQDQQPAETGANDPQQSEQALAAEAESHAQDKSAKPHRKTTQHRTHKSSNTGLLLLTFLLALAACGGIYYLWERDLKTSVHHKADIGDVNRKLRELTERQGETDSSLETAINTLKQEQEHLQHNLTLLVRDNKHLRNDWLMAEAEYLIKLANHRLLLEKDVETAQVALTAAESRLAEVGDPSLLNLRQSLANDIQALANVPRVDQAGISVIITSLINNIRQMPLRTPDPQSRKQQLNEQKHERQISNLSDLPGVIWEDIRSLIVIRQHDKAVEPLLAPEQHFFLVQNLALQLEQARLACLKSQAGIYQERLQKAEEWIKLFFDPEHNTTINMLNSLQELQARNIDPGIPDISSTYNLLQDYRLRGNRQVPAKEQKQPAAPQPQKTDSPS